MKTVIVGLDPGNNGGRPLSSDGASGRRLAELCELSSEEFEDRFDRINLHSKKSPESDDWRAGLNLYPILGGRRVIALGSRVANALGLVGEQMTWKLGERFVYSIFPHPSGLSRWWNDQSNVERARKFMTRSLRPCIHLEGFDGCGKSTLASWIAERKDMTYVTSQDPPDSFQECLRRVDARVGTGLVCDRSSGLVSEMVYGPVLRGSTMGGDEMMSLFRSVVHAVTFIYCRPPDDRINLTFRDEEDPEHVRGVKEQKLALLSKYDEVMIQLSREGANIISFDWTTKDQTPEGVWACVE